MSDYLTVADKPYAPPEHYVSAHQGAKEASDIRFLHSAAAVIKIGGVPMVAIENLQINMQVNRTPIYVVGSIVAIGFDQQGVQVNVSGQLVQLASMSLASSSFYVQKEEDILLNINRVFDIEIQMQDFTKDAAEVVGSPFLTIHNCQNTGANIVLNPNSMIKDSFTAVGTFLKRDWEVLKDFAVRAA